MTLAVGDVDFSDSVFLSYDTGEYIISIILFMLGVIGFSLNLFVLVANLDLQSKTPGTLLVLSVCVCEVILCSIGVIVPAFNMYHGGFSMGSIGCKFDGFIVFWAVVNVGFSAVVDRAVIWFSACYRYYLTTTHAWIIIANVWGLSLFLGLFPFATESENYAISLRTNKIMCMVTWTSKKDYAFALVLFILVLVAFLPGFLVFTITVVTRTFMAASKKRYEMNLQSTRNSSMKTKIVLNRPELTDAEKLVLNKGYYSTLSVVLWAPYAGLIIYEIASSQSVPEYYDSVATLFLLSSSVLISMLNVLYETRLRSRTKRLFQKLVNLISMPKPKLKSTESNVVKPSVNQAILLDYKAHQDKDTVVLGK